MARRSARPGATGSGVLPTHGSTPGRAWTAAWFAIAGAAVANGAVRERYLVPRFGEVRAQQISTGALVAVIWTVAAGLGRVRPLPDRASALIVACGWAGSTLTFEVGLGAAGSAAGAGGRLRPESRQAVGSRPDHHGCRSDRRRNSHPPPTGEQPHDRRADGEVA